MTSNKFRLANLRGIAVAAALAASAGSAAADDNGSSFALAVRPGSPLLHQIYARERVAYPQDGREYDYVTRGYLKVGGETVAQVGPLSGHADGSQDVVRIRVSALARRNVRAAGRRRGTRRVVLVMVHRITLTSNIDGDQAARRETLTQEVPLRISRL